MNSKDLLNNTTVVAFIPSLGTDQVITGDIVDLKGKGRKIHTVINAGTPETGAALDIVVQESNDADFTVGTPGAIDGAIDATQKYLDLHAGEGLNWPAIDEFDFTIDTEAFTCTKRVVDRLYIRRGQYSTTAAAHNNDAVLVLRINALHTFAQITAAGVVEADLAPNKRYVRVVSTPSTDAFEVGVIGIIYLEREIPSGI